MAVELRKILDEKNNSTVTIYFLLDEKENEKFYIIYDLYQVLSTIDFSHTYCISKRRMIKKSNSVIAR